MAGLDNNISNIIGKKLPQWVLNQLETRSNQNSRDSRDNENILYLANKSAWVRLVSSINLSESDQKYFKGIVGDISITSPESLAKEFVLFAGTSKYLGKNSYGLRSGIGKDGAYGILGTKEVQDYGYRPMPGITSVNIDTQGKLGSIRSATINFKCWDKSQLDIIDALYFKLGFTMFLEWGHTFFYPSKSNKIESTEIYSIDPFQENLTKEEIAIQIAKNSRESEGNYDAMLGMVTNFNFSYNQEGGFDCTLRLMALGVLGDSIKINNAGVLPNLLKEEILLYNNTLNKISAEIAAKKALLDNPPPTTEPPKIDKLKADDYFNKYITYYPDRANKYSGGQVSLNALDVESYKTIDAAFNTEAWGWVYFIRKQKGFIPIDDKYLKDVRVTLDAQRFLGKVNSIVRNGIKGPDNDKAWDYPLNFTDKLIDIFTNPIASIVNFFDYGELNKAEDTAVLNVPYKSTNGRSYNIKIERHLFAVSNREDIADSYGKGGGAKLTTFTTNAYYPIDTKTFLNQLKPVLESSVNKFEIKDVDPVAAQTTTTIKFTMPFTRQVDVVVKAKDIPNPDGSVTKVSETIKKDNVTYQLYTEISFDDSSIIKSIIVPDKITQPLDFVIQTEKKLVEQDQKEVNVEEEQKKQQDALETQIKEAISYESSLEITLRTIQVHALNQAINKSGNDLEIGRKVYRLNLLDSDQRRFTNQIFTNGIFTPFLDELISVPSKISDSLYLEKNGTEKINTLDRLKVYSKYGFATSLLGNKASIDTIEPTDFTQILNAYVIPYQINQQIVAGVATNHPVYIPFSLLLMILNHTCTIYDTKKSTDLQTPLVYIDFNTEINFCLSNTKQLTTNPWVTLIPFEGSNNDFASLFDKDILQAKDTEIKPLSGSTESVKLYKPQSDDLLSSNLPAIKFDTVSTSNAYRAKTMNILLNIDYLVKLVKEYSLKDGSNSVYLKTFLEQILSDVNKYLGNFNAFRLAYNDAANAFQIVDDQFIPALAGEDQVTPDDRKTTPNTDNRTQLPLFGKKSIAKSLEIKTEISSKLSNLIAISANSDVANKATLSTNGDSVGFINTSYVDRYVPNRTEPTPPKKNRDSLLDTIKSSAAQFNQAITDFYSKINPSENSVGQATNYYIDKMSKIKNDDFATRSSTMIPVSVNFSTDGISGLGMGQAFTIPDELLPYTYSARNSQQNLHTKKDYINKVGFVMVGLTHTIESNQWNTAVRANMIFLKDKTDFSGSVEKLPPKNDSFGANPNNVSDTLGGSGGGTGGGNFVSDLTSDKITVGPVTKQVNSFEEVTKQVIANLEGGYFSWKMFDDGRIKDPSGKARKAFGKSGETMFGIDRLRGGTLNTGTAGTQFWGLIDSADAANKWPYNHIPADPLKTQLLNLAVQVMKPAFESLFNDYVKKEIQDVVKSDGRLYFNFIYATWNGPGYFKAFSKQIEKAYNSGQKSSEELLKVFINLRLNTRIFWPNTDDNSFNLVRNGGKKIAKLTGVILSGENTA